MGHIPGVRSQSGFAGCALVLVLVLAGCGNSDGPEGKALLVESPVLTKGVVVPARYRCSDKSIWLPLAWSRVPNATSEIVLSITVSRLKHKQGAVRSTLVDEWVVGGLDHHRRKLSVGDLPNGAFIKRHSVAPACPQDTQESALVFSVYAMPSGHRLKPFEAIGVSTLETLADSALSSGSMIALYGVDNR
jgi:phosphatidylethanolamine-binding protein (PEBP) family uncharacterized protein